MRTILVAIAGALGLAAGYSGALSPAQAAGVAGYGEAGIGWADFNTASGYSLSNLPVYSGGGTINIPLVPGLNVEAEARGYQVDQSGGLPTSDLGEFVHVYWRDPQRFAVGGFGGTSRLGLYGMEGRMFTGGAEAQLYAGKLTLYGQVASFNSTTEAGWLYFNGGFVRGTARYFATPNLSLQFDAQWDRIDNSDHTSATTLVGTAEYRFQALPFSAFARVRYDRLAPAVNQEMNTTMVVFGVRAYFGSGSLLDNDRNGAPLDVLPFPPLYALNFG